MKCVDRFTEYKDEDFDKIYLYIRNGTIKSGRYSHLVKIDKDKLMKGKELFKDGSESK